MEPRFTFHRRPAIDRKSFRSAYRAARWTLSNRPLAELAIGLPANPNARATMIRVLADAGLLTMAYLRSGFTPPPFATDRLAAKATYLASPPAGLLDLRVLRAL